MHQTLLCQLNVVMMNIKANSIAARVTCCNECSSTAHKWVQNKFSLVGKEFDTSTRQSNGMGGRMFRFVSNISPFIMKLPYPQLTFDPFFGSQAVYVSRRAIA